MKQELKFTFEGFKVLDIVFAVLGLLILIGYLGTGSTIFAYILLGFMDVFALCGVAYAIGKNIS